MASPPRTSRPCTSEFCPAFKGLRHVVFRNGVLTATVQMLEFCPVFKGLRRLDERDVPLLEKRAGQNVALLLRD